jgi:outer membrane cobalamin receptor
MPPVRCLRLPAILVIVLATHAAHAQVPVDHAATGTIRGIVLDRADGSPISDVSVRVEDAGRSVNTDAAGRFELTGISPGRRVVFVSVIGFILVRRPVDVVAGASLELTIVLSEGTGTYTETVDVAGERFREQEKSVPSQLTLGSADIQNLRNLLTNDPMRAIQVLPGVTTGDDFHSEFAVRGSPFAKMNFTFDGVPTALLLHTVPQVQDGGSIAMLNGDILDGITLLNGSYPQRYGNRLGAELDFHMREGSRSRTQTRIGVSGTDASLVVEGPLGRAKAGSWLVSLRKSYLELLLKQVSDDTDDFGFGFSDAQSKVTYDVSSRHRLELSLVAGRSRLDQDVSSDDINEVADGRNRAGLLGVSWRFAVSPTFVITERFAAGAQVFRNSNVSNVELGSGAARELTWRTDFVAMPRPSINVEGGGQLQSQHRDEVAVRLTSAPSPLRIYAYDDGSRLASAYGQVRWTRSSRASATAGARVDHWSLTGDAEVSPWLQGDLQLPGRLRLRGGTGVYRQFPGIPELTGTHGNHALRPERAYHADAGLEQTLGGSARWQITFYNREERDVLRLPASELRVVAGRLAGISLTAPWGNALTGHARGVELLVQRRSNAGLTGWLSYSYGVNRYRDVLTGETFDGDFDQRHTLNAYGLYRLSNRFSLMGKLRMGSNTPAIGYWEERGDLQFVGSTRNDVRLPLYSRLDVRANRTFNWEAKRLTLFVEVMNVLNRDNVRYETPGVNLRTLQAFGMFATMIPLIPSAGMLIEF